MNCKVKESLKFPSKKENEKQGKKKKQTKTTKPPNRNGQQKPAAKINCLGMCLSPFAYALQDVVFPSVYLLRASPAAPKDEQGRGKNTSPDLGEHLHIPCRDFLVTLHHFPALRCRPKEQTRIQSHHFACSVLGLHPEGRKKPLTLRLPAFPRHSTIGLNSFKHSKEHLRRQLCHMQHFILSFIVLTHHCTVTLPSLSHPAVFSGAFLCFELVRELNLYTRIMQQSAEHLIYPRGDILES